jgi:hypothetical protein
LPTDSSTLSVADLTLAVGEYTFGLTVVKGSRSDTASVDVEIVAGAPPVISITALTEDKYNTDALFVSVVSLDMLCSIAMLRNFSAYSLPFSYIFVFHLGEHCDIFT